MGLFSIFNMGLQSINAYSSALNVVSNNISNANNENYTRQRVNLGSMNPDQIGGMEIGRGVYLSGVEQVVDTFVETRIMDAKQATGEAEARSDYLKSVDSIFNELDGSGLNTSISDFFDSWSGLAAEPDSLSVRNNVLNSAQNMADVFEQYGDSLDQLRTTVDKEIRATIPQINDILTQIRDLNTKINQSPTDALTYQDDRRALLKELSHYVDINVVEDSSTGMAQVYTTSGNLLVNGDSVAEFSTLPDATNDNLLDIYVTMEGVATDVTSRLQGGRLKGLIDVRDTDIAGYQDRLDNLAYGVMTQVNALHSTGFDLDGNTGNNFFTDLGAAPGGVVNAAQNLTIDASVLGSPRAIAASTVLAEIPGNNLQALAIAALSESSGIDFDHGAGTDFNSFTGYFGEILADIGSDSLIAENTYDFQSGLLNQANLERSSKSGVNIDEEEINIIKFQAAIKAASQMVKVANEILDALVNIL